MTQSVLNDQELYSRDCPGYPDDRPRTDPIDIIDIAEKRSRCQVADSNK